ESGVGIGDRVDDGASAIVDVGVAQGDAGEGAQSAGLFVGRGGGERPGEQRNLLGGRSDFAESAEGGAANGGVGIGAHLEQGGDRVDHVARGELLDVDGALRSAGGARGGENGVGDTGAVEAGEAGAGDAGGVGTGGGDNFGEETRDVGIAF